MVLHEAGPRRGPPVFAGWRRSSFGKQGADRRPGRQAARPRSPGESRDAGSSAADAAQPCPLAGTETARISRHLRILVRQQTPNHARIGRQCGQAAVLERRYAPFICWKSLHGVTIRIRNMLNLKTGTGASPRPGERWSQVPGSNQGGRGWLSQRPLAGRLSQYSSSALFQRVRAATSFGELLQRFRHVSRKLGRGGVQ